MNKDSNTFYNDYELPEGLIWHMSRKEQPLPLTHAFIEIRNHSEVFYTKSVYTGIGWDAGGQWYWEDVVGWAEISKKEG